MKLPATIENGLRAALILFACCSLAQAQGNHFNTRGNILIADQFNNRVIEVNPETHQIVWEFGDGSSTAEPHSIVGITTPSESARSR